VKRSASAAAAVIVLAAAADARATPVFELLPTSGGGLSPVVSGPSGMSAYFNPALLADADDAAEVGFGLLSEQIEITLDGRRAGADVPLAVGARTVLGPDGKPIANDSVPTQWLKSGCSVGSGTGQCPAPAFGARPRQSQGTGSQTHGYLLFDGVKTVVKDRVAVGAYVALPTDHLTSAESFYVDEREQLFSNSLHPELYGDRLTAISIAVGGSFRILKSLSVGVGTTFGLANSATAATYVRDASNYGSLLINNDVGVTVSLSPIFGVAWSPFAWLRVGASLHAPEKLEIDEAISSTLPDGTSSSTTRAQVHDYMPWRESLGVEVDAVKRPRTGLAVAAQIEQLSWASYQDRHGDSPSTYGEAYAWSDTVNVSVGVRPRVGRVKGFVDMQYAPSPVPTQVGRSNYVDNDRLGLSLGGSVDVTIGGVHLKPGLSLVGYRMIPRHAEKDDSELVDELPDRSRYANTGDLVLGAHGLQTNNPGWPGFGSDGWLYGGTVTLEAIF
jgi:hypothetical protein